MSDTTQPEDALRILQEGNVRFVAGRREHPHEFLTRARETADTGQKPLAVILGCSDSRVPLEIIFDQGLGDIFVIRVAGNVCGPAVIGSIEFAIKRIGTMLCVILGHTQCGAVTAAYHYEKHEDNIDELIAAIEPAIQRVELNCNDTDTHTEEWKDTDFINACCKENVFLQMEYLFQQSRVVCEAVRRGKLLVVGALYDIEVGVVTFLEPPPHLAELLSIEEHP